MSIRVSSSVIKDYHVSSLAKYEANDCVVKAVAVIAECTYDEAHKSVKKHMKRYYRTGVPTPALYKYMNERHYPVITEHADHLPIGQSKIKYQPHTTYVAKRTGKKTFCKMTVGTFAKQFNQGKYYVLIKGHIFAIVNGEILGNRQDATKIRTYVLRAWKVYREIV